MKHVDPLEITMTASISECGFYRYSLTRRWGAGKLLAFIMLNPSKADAKINDPTIKRCMAFARRLGYAGIIVMNLYGWRTKDPDELAKVGDPSGAENFVYLTALAKLCVSFDVPIVCAWGSSKYAAAAAPRVIQLLKDADAHAMCLKKTAKGMPWHPLYVPANQEFEVFP